MSDHTARLVLLTGFALVLPIGLCFRMRSHTSERLDRSLEGPLVLLTLRPLALACMLGTVAFVLNPEWMSWAAIRLAGWIRWLGVAVGILAALVMVWTFRALGRNLTDTVVVRRDAALVQHGPYRFVRHPFYIAFFLVVLANSLVTANLFVAVTGFAAFAMVVVRTHKEEQLLIERFGEAYVRYMQQTGRFLPRLTRAAKQTKPEG